MSHDSVGHSGSTYVCGQRWVRLFLLFPFFGFAGKLRQSLVVFISFSGSHNVCLFACVAFICQASSSASGSMKSTTEEVVEKAKPARADRT
jgi:hypothetical protein